ncbi:MAG TPA: hypothetical protein VFI22_08735 [Thermomicrobiales bacterium]|nr:hypothetical protein [Thermomicrobiales bacterium]
MSAFVVSHKHITVLVTAAIHYGVGFPREFARVAADPDAAGQRLHEVNVASVNHRYDEHDEPEPYDYAACWTPALAAIAHDPVRVIKATQCFDDQACELPDWDTRPEKRFCDSLVRHAIDALPGYAAADWSID